MLLYRYLTCAHGLEALQTKRWKVGRLSELNDPLDCFPNLKNAPTTGSDLGDREHERQFWDSRNARMGILCFSEKIDDPVIWSHYAQAHTGIALGFDVPNLELAVQFLKVSYPPDGIRPITDWHLVEPRNSKDRTEGNRQITAAYTVKAPSWHYEAERRRFVELHSCQMIGSHFFQEIPHEWLKRVVLGVRCVIHERDIRNVLKSYSNEGSDIAIFRAQMNKESYTLKIERRDAR